MKNTTLIVIFPIWKKEEYFYTKLNGVHDNNVIKPIETRLWLSDNHCFAERDYIKIKVV
jgi:hypothetical protein